MILVTIGTNEQPFDRLIRAATTLGGDEPLLVQHGSSRVPHGRGEWVDFLSFDELADRARQARVVVCHAGVGSIMLARRCGHRPVVVPRRHQLGEAVDDHQLFLARHDSDPFNRWQALQDVGMALAVDGVQGRPWRDAAVTALSQAMSDTLASNALDNAFKALALSLPDEQLIGREIGTDIDPDKIHAVRKRLLQAVFEPLAEQMLGTYNALANAGPYTPDPVSTGRRALRNRMLTLLVASEAFGAALVAVKQN